MAIIICYLHSLNKDWRVDEAAFSLMSGDQSLGLLAQLLVVTAHLREQGCPRICRKLQCLMEESFQFFPAFRCHRRSDDERVTRNYWSETALHLGNCRWSLSFNLVAQPGPG